MINREDMLELTRRMTIKRSCIDRVAGGYMDREGQIDDTFNINFLKLKDRDKTKNLALAKQVPFAKSNEELQEFRFSKTSSGPGSMRQLLEGIRTCSLKNDLLMEVLYEQIGSVYQSSREYGIIVFHGVYDIPRKNEAGEWLQDSEEIYDFIICGIASILEDYELGEIEAGFLYPAFSDRSAMIDGIDIFSQKSGAAGETLKKLLLG